MADYEGVERREGYQVNCNCGSLKELAAELHGEIALTTMEIKNMRQHFEEAHLMVKECVIELQAGSTALRLGESRFDSLEDDLKDHKTGKLGQHTRINTVLKTLAIGLCTCTFALGATGHGKELWAFIKELL